MAPQPRFCVTSNVRLGEVVFGATAAMLKVRHEMMSSQGLTRTVGGL